MSKKKEDPDNNNNTGFDGTLNDAFKGKRFQSEGFDIAKRKVIENIKEVFLNNDEALKNELKESQCSITPKTFCERTLVKVGENFTHYVEKFAHEGNSVLRFGINPSMFTRDSLEKEEVLYDNHSKAKSITSTNFKGLKTKVIHHTYEKVALTEAIRHLLESDNKNNKTVIVDILKRGIDDGQMKVILETKNYTKEPIPSTHSVLLFKNPVKNEKHDIVVIDPSNFLFSSHLSDLATEIQKIVKSLGKIETLDKGFTIYKPGTNLGILPEEYRDCTDLSAKLAFLFNDMNEKVVLDEQFVKNNEILKMVSNDSTIDTSIDAKLMKGLSVRIKQSSDVEQIKKFYKVNVAVDKLKKLESNVIKTARDFGVEIKKAKLEPELQEILQKNHNSCLEAFVEHFTEYKKVIKQGLDLIGKEAENFNID